MKISDLFKRHGAKISSPFRESKDVRTEPDGPMESDNGIHRRIVTVLDESDSMIMIKHATETGLQKFLDDQRASYPNTRVSLVQFNGRVTTSYVDRKIADVPYHVMHPNGSTALYRAIHEGVAVMERSLSAIPATEKSEKIVVILTDGAENSSGIGFSQEKVRDLITAKRAQGWIFIFLGADENAMNVGVSMGVSAETSVAYDLSKAGHTFTAVSAMVSRGSETGDYSATPAVRISLRKD